MENTLRDRLRAQLKALSRDYGSMQEVSSDDPRLKYFKPKDILLRDSLVPALQDCDLWKESDRLADCGRQFFMLQCNNGKYHDTVNFGFPCRCELRICCRCCGKRAYQLRKDIRAMLSQVQKTRTHRYMMMTLTKKMTKDRYLTPEKVRSFDKDIRKLINEMYPKSRGCGAVSNTEIGPNFNLHAHILVFGHYVGQKTLSKRWLELTGDSFIVDIRLAYNQDVLVDYLTKYISKPPSFPNPKDYALYLKAIKGVRRLHRFGVLYAFKTLPREKLKCPYCGGRLKFDSKISFSDFKYHCEDYWEAVALACSNLN